jgi:hypothetical protein
MRAYGAAGSASGPCIQSRTEVFATLHLKTILATVPVTARTIGALRSELELQRQSTFSMLMAFWIQ